MNKQKLNVWGRNFVLEVVYNYYAGEDVLPFQKEVLTQFLAHRNLIASAKEAV